MPKSEILPLFNFSLIPIHHLSILAGRKDKRNDLKKNTPQIKILIFRALGCQNNLSLTLIFMIMETKKTYIVITRYAMRDNNIGMVLTDSLEEAMKEATNELNVAYTKQVEIFEADQASYVFFGKRIFNKTKH